MYVISSFLSWGECIGPYIMRMDISLVWAMTQSFGEEGVNEE